MSGVEEAIDSIEPIPVAEVVRFGALTQLEAAKKGGQARSRRSRERAEARGDKAIEEARKRVAALKPKDAQELATTASAVVNWVLLQVLGGHIPITNAATAEKIARMAFDVAQVSLGKPTNITESDMTPAKRKELIAQIEEKVGLRPVK